MKKGSLQTLTLPQLGNVFCLNKPEAIVIHKEIFLDKEYFHPKINLPENAVVFDLGANIGFFSLYIADMLDKKPYKLFSFEPVKEACDVFKENVSARGLDNNIKVFNVGLSAEEGKKDFTFYKNTSVISTYLPDMEGAHIESLKGGDRLLYLIEQGYPRLGKVFRLFPFLLSLIAPIIVKNSFQKQTVTCHFDTLPLVIQREGIQRIDLLKIDIEGAEMDVLESLDKHHWSLIENIIMEGHIVEQKQLLVEMLASHGFTVEVDDDSGASYFMVYAYRAK